jgi:hypothetical protein
LVQGHVGTATGTEAPTSIATDLGDNQLRADGRLVDTDSDGVNDSTLVTLLYDADSSLGSIEYSYRQMYLDGDVTDTVLLDGLFNYDTLVLNAAPGITSDHVTSANEDSAYSYAITAVDAEGTNVTLSVTLDGAEIPDNSWLSFSNNTLSGTPDNDDVGTYALAVTALDEDGQSATETFTLTVVNTNDAPVLTITPDTTAAQGEAYTQTFSIADVDVGDEVDGTVTVNGVDITADDYDGSSWLSITDNEDGSFTLSGTPTVTQAGTTQTVVITASDGEATDTETVAIAVSEPPAFFALSVIEDYAVDLLTYDVLAIAVDLDEVNEALDDPADTAYFKGFTLNLYNEDGSAFDTGILAADLSVGGYYSSGGFSNATAEDPAAGAGVKGNPLYSLTNLEAGADAQNQTIVTYFAFEDGAVDSLGSDWDVQVGGSLVWGDNATSASIDDQETLTQQLIVVDVL